VHQQNFALPTYLLIKNELHYFIRLFYASPVFISRRWDRIKILTLLFIINPLTFFAAIRTVSFHKCNVRDRLAPRRKDSAHSFCDTKSGEDLGDSAVNRLSHWVTAPITIWKVKNNSIAENISIKSKSQSTGQENLYFYEIQRYITVFAKARHRTVF